MNQPFEKLSEIASRLQAPFQALTELNVKTIQGLTFVKPEDLTNLKKPEQLIEMQINAAVENGHKTLDYVQESFEIIEKAMLSFVQDVKKEMKNPEQRH